MPGNPATHPFRLYRKEKTITDFRLLGKTLLAQPKTPDKSMPVESGRAGRNGYGSQPITTGCKILDTAKFYMRFVKICKALI